MRNKKSTWVGLVVILAALLLTALALAQSGGTALLWDSEAARGRSAGGGYTLSGAIGEPFGGVSSAGGFTLRDGGPMGATGGSPVGNERLYLPTIIR